MLDLMLRMGSLNSQEVHALMALLDNKDSVMLAACQVGVSAHMLLPWGLLTACLFIFMRRVVLCLVGCESPRIFPARSWSRVIPNLHSTSFKTQCCVSFASAA